jgi:hypothetical protein
LHYLLNLSKVSFFKRGLLIASSYTGVPLNIAGSWLYIFGPIVFPLGRAPNLSTTNFILYAYGNFASEYSMKAFSTYSS